MNALSSPSNGKEVVYFLGNWKTKRFKIGTSIQRAARVRSLENEHKTPLVLIGEIKGGRGVEQRIHRHLADHRVTGEWFTDCPEVRRTIGTIICEGEFLTDYDKRRRREDKEQSERQQPWDDMRVTLSAQWPLVKDVPQAQLILEAALWRWVQAYAAVMPAWCDGDPAPIVTAAQVDVARVLSEIRTLVEQPSNRSL